MKQTLLNYHFFIGLNYLVNNEVEWHHYDVVHSNAFQPIKQQYGPNYGYIGRKNCIMVDAWFWNELSAESFSKSDF